MPSAELLERLAAVIHDLWREDAASDGWTYDAVFDDLMATHDAMVPFSELKGIDRRDVLSIAEEWVDRLVEDVEYPRGDDREFTLDEVFIGMPVGWSRRVRSEGGSGGPNPDDEIGRITDWSVSPDGKTMEVIRVMWPDGCVTECFPIMRELRRVQ